MGGRRDQNPSSFFRLIDPGTPDHRNSYFSIHIDYQTIGRYEPVVLNLLLFGYSSQSDQRRRKKPENGGDRNRIEIGNWDRSIYAFSEKPGETGTDLFMINTQVARPSAKSTIK
jgi:hypothetical protein